MGATSEPVPTTRLVNKEKHWQLLRDGQPFLIKGAGGDGSKALLKATGANSFRTWGADTLQHDLDEAQKLGLTVSAGIWLGHAEQGFNYSDPKQVADQFNAAKVVIDRFKNHPALLVWSIGNEMEGYNATTDPKMWASVQQIAAYAHKVDPNHPTMTVVAEIGGDKVASLNKLCPDVDIVGINSYAGGPSLGERYVKAGGTKPFVITEFGPPGTWELPKTAWGSVAEPTSTQKGQAYRATWEKSIAGSPLCLGGYAFAWGNKQEASATWFGMMLPDGTRLGAIDALTQEWTGKPPANQAPRIEALALQTPERTDPNAVAKAILRVSDAEKNPLKVQWVLQHDPMVNSVGGQTQAVPPTFPDAIQSSSNTEVTVKMPPYGGGYRLFAYVRDGKGGGATGNIPLFVGGGEKLPDSLLNPTAQAGEPAPKATLPLEVLGDANGPAPYTASGYMGKADAIHQSQSTDNPHSGTTSLQVQYLAPADWGGVVWQSPANDWGDKPGGYDLSGAKKLSFWARGAKGGERVSFSFGILGADKKYPDSAKGESGALTLSNDWKQYSIDLAGRDLSHIKTGFCWVVQGQGQPITFYLDDVRYE